MRNINRVVIAGIQSEICIDATCRRAYSLGYDVTLVKNGHSTYNSTVLSASQIIEHHNEIIGQWFARVKNSESNRVLIPFPYLIVYIFFTIVSFTFKELLSNELVPRLPISTIRRELSISQFHQLMDSSHSFTLFYR